MHPLWLSYWNLCAVCRLPFAKKSFSSCSRKKVGQKCWWNWPLPSISSTLNTQIFRTNVCFGSFFLVTCTMPKWRSYEKFLHLLLINWHLVSIFNQHFTRVFFIRKFIQSQTVTRKKARVNRWWNWLLEEKFVFKCHFWKLRNSGTGTY